MLIIKIGGGSTINIKGIAEDLSKLNQPAIIVHGANYYRDELLEKLKVEKQILTSISGVSSVYTTSELIDTMMMTYAGLRNKRIVEIFQQEGLNAIGLSGLDGGLVKGQKNKGIKIYENGKKKIKRDLSGKPKSVNLDLLNYFLQNNYIPILTMPILDEQNNAINSENDDLVALLCTNLMPDKVFMLIEAEGYLDNDTVKKIPIINKKMIAELSKSSRGRIQRKLQAIEKIMTNKKIELYISDGRISKPLTNAKTGTLVKF